MAAKQYYHDLDLVKVGQLVNARFQNVTNAELSALAATLDGTSKGLVVYNSDDQRIYTWDGTAFDPFQIDVEGDLKFKGVVDASTSLDGQVEKVSGYQYVVGTAGTLSATGVTFNRPEAESGDIFFFTSDTTAYVIQRNDVNATEEVAGNVRLATQAEVNAGSVNDEAVTPATLKGYIDPILAGQAAKDLEQDDRLTAVENKNTEQDGRLTSIEAKNVEQDGRLDSAELRLDAVEAKNTEQDGRLVSLEADRVKHFFTSVNLTTGVNTITHNLNLADKDGFVINTQLGGSQISLDVDSVNANSITLSTLVPLTAVKVTVIGRAAV